MADKKTCGIYKITNTITNETYIGQSKHIEKRVAIHKEDLKNGNHNNNGMQQDYDLAKSLNPNYEIFNFEIIKEAKAKDLNKEEMFWINEFNSFERGYNRTIGGIHDETKGHVDYGGGRLFIDEKRIKLITKELTNDFDNKENYIFKTTSNHVLCSKCGKEFNDGFDFCPFCGTKKPPQKICPKCKLEPSIEFSFCPKCGTELIDKEIYLKLKSGEYIAKPLEKINHGYFVFKEIEKFGENEELYICFTIGNGTWVKFHDKDRRRILRRCEAKFNRIIHEGEKELKNQGNSLILIKKEEYDRMEKMAKKIEEYFKNLNKIIFEGMNLSEDNDEEEMRYISEKLEEIKFVIPSDQIISRFNEIKFLYNYSIMLTDRDFMDKLVEENEDKIEEMDRLF